MMMLPTRSVVIIPRRDFIFISYIFIHFSIQRFSMFDYNGIFIFILHLRFLVPGFLIILDSSLLLFLQDIN